MSFRVVLGLSALVAAISAHGALPFAPKQIEIYDSAAKRDNNFSQLTIRLTSRDQTSGDRVTVGGVVVCSSTECFKAYAPNKSVKLEDTRNGGSAELVQLRVPIITIESIHFESIAGDKTVAGDVRLDNSLELKKDIQGGEVLVLVSPAKVDKRLVYAPTDAVGLIASPQRESVYYNPNVDTSARLSLNTRIDIPRGATKRAQIFSVAVHDTGDAHPLVDIYPVVDLAVPAKLSSRRILRSKPGVTPLVGATDSTGPEASQEITSTGVVRVNNARRPTSSSSSASGMVSTAAATDGCVEFLNNSAVEVSSKLSTTGSVYLTGCEANAPFVHIAITNNSDPRERLMLRYSATGNSGSQLNLQPIENFSSSSQITLNGFTWAGDTGIGGGLGYARGFVQYNENVIGSNRINGGTEGAYDGNKLAVLVQPTIPARWREGSQPPLWTTGSEGVEYPYTVVSSSTSILKNGACSGDTSSNRWSAVGTTPGNRLIFVSSTSSGVTTAAELCAVFQSLGANYAIRLDGSTATGITIDGFRKNPITGMNSFIYGSSRYIAYALAVVYPVGLPGFTPVIEAPTIVNPPKDPCKIRPAACG